MEAKEARENTALQKKKVSQGEGGGLDFSSLSIPLHD